MYTKQLLMGGERGEQVEGVSWGFMAKYRSHYEEIESKSLPIGMIMNTYICAYSVAIVMMFSTSLPTVHANMYTYNLESYILV